MPGRRANSGSTRTVSFVTYSANAVENLFFGWVKICCKAKAKPMIHSTLSEPLLSQCYTLIRFLSAAGNSL